MSFDSEARVNSKSGRTRHHKRQGRYQSQIGSQEPPKIARQQQRHRSLQVFHREEHARKSCFVSGVSKFARVADVVIGPGAIMFTVIPSRARSTAACPRQAILLWQEQFQSWVTIHATSRNTLSLTAHVAHTLVYNSLISLYCRSNPSWAHNKTYAQKTVFSRSFSLLSSVHCTHSAHETGHCTRPL